MNKKICEMVTERIVKEMERGIIPWRRPWTGSTTAAISHSTGKPYSLLNQIILGRAGEYITFKQVTAEGGKVKKGEKGHPVVFWKMQTVTETDSNGEPREKLIPFLRYYTVFHIDQCEGITAKHTAEAPATAPVSPVEAAEQIVKGYAERESNLRIERKQESNSAYYSPALDKIVVPCLEQYSDSAEYYSTLFHEMVHSTGHSTRLNRFTGTAAAAAFGGEEYSKEELTAEIGAAALVNACGIDDSHSITNSAAYIQSWLKALKNDPTMIITAAGKAEKATAYITDNQSGERGE